MWLFMGQQDETKKTRIEKNTFGPPNSTVFVRTVHQIEDFVMGDIALLSYLEFLKTDRCNADMHVLKSLK